MTRKKLFEMMNKLNNTSLNENYDIDVLTNTYYSLQNGTLNIENTSTRLEDTTTYITINAIEDNSKIEFVFKVVVEDDSQSDVFSIDDIKLTSFKYNSTEDNIEISGDSLDEFNKTNSNSMYDTIEEYLDIETEIERDDELEENAIKLIENINKEEFFRDENNYIRDLKLNPDKFITDIYYTLPHEKQLNIAYQLDKALRNDGYSMEKSKEEYMKAASLLLFNSIKTSLEMQNESKT